MPPKPMVNREDVLAAALALVRRRGMEGVNARNIAELLGCSTKPIFRLYENMEELRQDLFSRINRSCSDYIREYPGFAEDYIGVALRYIGFARDEPNLFAALFMDRAMPRAAFANMMADRETEGLVDRISADAEVSREEARAIYKKMWLISHGIASLLVTNGSLFEWEEAGSILEEACRGFMLTAKYGGKKHGPGVL